MDNSDILEGYKCFLCGLEKTWVFSYLGASC
jgi:hypothetical protein